MLQVEPEPNREKARSRVIVFQPVDSVLGIVVCEDRRSRVTGRWPCYRRSIDGSGISKSCLNTAPFICRRKAYAEGDIRGTILIDGLVRVYVLHFLVGGSASRSARNYIARPLSSTSQGTNLPAICELGLTVATASMKLVTSFGSLNHAHGSPFFPNILSQRGRKKLRVTILARYLCGRSETIDVTAASDSVDDGAVMRLSAMRSRSLSCLLERVASRMTAAGQTTTLSAR